jgi:outer membrane receptor protein involved in Fe transport
MTRSVRRPKLSLLNRKAHRWGALLVAVPFGIVLVTGLLLQLKKELSWVQPPAQRGRGSAPTISFERILAAARSAPEAGVGGWGDVDRIDVQPRRGLVKVISRSRWELQLDATDGRLLHAAYRRSDLIEALHDGSWFHERAKLGIFLPAGLVVLLLWGTGLYLFFLPLWVRGRRRIAAKSGAGDEHRPAAPAPSTAPTPRSRHVPGRALLALVAAGASGRAEAADEAGAGAPAAVEVVAEGPLYESIVTASRHEEADFESPRSVATVTRESIQRRGARTTPEALAETPGVFVQSTNYGGGAPIVRGQLGNRVLLLVDGIRLNNATYRGGPNQYLNTVDPLLVSSIEIVRGAGSAVHGSDAIGGTINVVTEAPRLDGSGAYGDLHVRAGSADRSGWVGVRGGYGGERAGLLFVASGRRFGDVRAAGGGPQAFTGYEEWSAAAAGAWAPSAAGRLSLSAQLTTQHDVPRSDRSTPLDFRVFARQSRALAYVRYEHAPEGGSTRWRATLSYSHQGETADRYRIDRDLVERERVSDGVLGAQLEAAHELGAAGRLTTGFDAYWDRIRSDASRASLAKAQWTERPALRRYPDDVGYATAALFAHHALPLASWLTLVSEGRLGLTRTALPRDERLSLAFPELGLDPLDARDATVPHYAGGAYLRTLLSPSVAVSTGVTLGFRTPNLDDYARLGAEGPSYVLPARTLAPERALGGELTVKAAPGRTSVTATYAYTHLFDALARRPATFPQAPRLDDLPIARVTNADFARYHSVEIGLHAFVWRRLAVLGDFAYTHADQSVYVETPDGAGADRPTRVEPGTKVPPAFGRVGVGYHPLPKWWFAEATMRFALHQGRLSDIDRGDARICPDVPGRCAGTPGWATLSVRAGYRFGAHVSTVLGLENLLDRAYRAHASGIDAPGRSGHLSLEVSL